MLIGLRDSAIERVGPPNQQAFPAVTLVLGAARFAAAAPVMC